MSVLRPVLVRGAVAGAEMNMTREEARRCVGPGWAKLIDAIYDKLPDDACIMQVKEKYGTLRFYVNGSDELQDLISEMEAKSETTCEVCGEVGKLEQRNGWWRTRCEEHA